MSRKVRRDVFATAPTRFRLGSLQSMYRDTNIQSLDVGRSCCPSPEEPLLSLPCNVAVVFGLLVAGCGAVSFAATHATKFPLTESGPELSLRATSKALTGHSASVTVQLTTLHAQEVKVILTSRAASLSVTPRECQLHAAPPSTVTHTTGPPYSLPVIPLCTFVVSASAAGRYHITLIILDSVGRNLLPPVTGILSFEGVEQ
jgi:hypothetical protein